MSGESSGRRRVLPRLYIAVGVLLVVLPLLGYGVIAWLDSHRKWAEECFRAPLRVLEGDADSVCSVAFSPDGTRALSGGSDRTLRLWNLGSGKELLKLEGHTGTVWSVAFSADVCPALSGGLDWTLRLWKLWSG